MSKEKHIRFDWAIKRLLRQKSNFGILEGFLSELFNFDIKIEEILESEGNKLTEQDKFNRVDILAKDQNEQLILVEVQNEKQHDYFHRMNYGQAKLVTEHISSGDTYDKVKKVFSVNIVYFELGQGQDYVYIGKNEFRGIHFQDLLQLSDKQKSIYPAKEISDIFTTYYILKVNNFDDNSHTSLDEWIYFLKNSEIKDEFKAKGLQEAKEKLRIDNLQGIEKDEYEIFIKDQRNKGSEIKTAFIDGQLEAQKLLIPKIKQAEAKAKIAEAKAEQERAEKEKERAEKLELLNNAVLSLHKAGLTIVQIAQTLNSNEAIVIETINKYKE